MRTLKEITLELLEKYEEERTAVLDEYSGKLSDYDDLSNEITAYKEEIEKALASTTGHTDESSLVKSDANDEDRTEDDQISRRAAIDALEKSRFPGAPYIDTGIQIAMREIKELPSAHPQRKGWVHIDDIYRLIAGHSDYHGDNILSALTCLTEGKKVLKPITVLDTEPENSNAKEEKSTSDCISRQDMLDIVLEYSKRLYKHVGTPEDNEMFSFGRGLLLSIERNLKNLPSAPQRTGRWIPVDSYSAYGGDEEAWMAHGNPTAFYYCSECKKQNYMGEDGEPLLTECCPHCGARMEGE